MGTKPKERGWGHKTSPCASLLYFTAGVAEGLGEKSAENSGRHSCRCVARGRRRLSRPDHPFPTQSPDPLLVVRDSPWGMAGGLGEKSPAKRKRLPCRVRVPRRTAHGVAECHLLCRRWRVCKSRGVANPGCSRLSGGRG